MVRGNFDLTDKELGNFKVVRRLGKGGMATVYKAHELSLNRMVALKVLEPHLSEDPAFIKRFQREAQAAAQLNHPNIVQIYAIGEEDGVHYIAMEYVKGEPLSDIIRKEGYFDPKRAVRVIRQTAESLREAHRAGLVHRDVKPHNILLDSTGRVKVTDFGIAFIPQADTRLTQAGAVIGTPEYISPEQCQSKPVDARSDLYSLGVTFYEMLTGKTPYQADTPVSMLMKIVEGKFLPLAEVNPDVPEPLRRIVEKMMNPDAALRYQNADEVIAALDAWSRGEAVPQAPPPLPASAPQPAPPLTAAAAASGGDNTKNALILAAVLLLLVGLAFGAWKLTSSPRNETTGETAQTGAETPAGSSAEAMREEAPAAKEVAGDSGDRETPVAEDTRAAGPSPVAEAPPGPAERPQPEAPAVLARAQPESRVSERPAVKRAEPPKPQPPWNSIAITVEGDYEASLIDSLAQSRFRDARYEVLDPARSGRKDLSDIARYHGVVSVRQLGSQTLSYYGRESELFTVSLNMKVVLTENGKLVAGPRSQTVKYTAMTAEENLGNAVTELSYSLQEEISRRGTP